MTTNANAATTTTTRPGRPLPKDAPTPAPAPAAFPDFPPRNDLMNSENLHDYGNQPALRLHLGNPDTTVVLGETPIYWRVPTGRAGVRVPDLLIAFNIRRALISAQKGFSIADQGKPPDFVLEVASDSTARNDETAKRRDYAAFGATEYWLFDPDWGQRYERGLIGWTLVQGSYEPIAIHQYGPELHYGWSDVLGLYVCWEYGRLRWYDPAVGYLRTHDEERSGRIAAEDRLEAAETHQAEERSGRIAAEDRLEAAEAQRAEERSGRIAAEDRLEAAETQRAEERSGRIAAEAESQRLLEELARLRAAEDDA